MRVDLEGLDLPMSAEAFAEVQKEHCDKVRKGVSYCIYGPCVCTTTIEYIFMLHLYALTRCLLSLFVSSPIVNLLSSFASSLNIEQVVESLLGADWHRGVLDRMMDSVKGYVCTTVNRSAIVLG